MTEPEKNALEQLEGLRAEELGDWVQKRGSVDRMLLCCEQVEKLALSDLGRATAVSALLLQAADMSDDPPVRARARRARAQALAYANQFEPALVLLEQAASLSEAAGQTAEVARAKLTTLHALARLGRLEEAVQAGRAAHALASACGESLLAARADINLGVTSRMRDDPRTALTHFDRARPLVLDQPMLLAQLESNRAEALLDVHDFQGAETAFRSALAAFRVAGASRAAGIVEGNLADLAGRQGRLGVAIDHFEQARLLLADAHAPGDAARLAAEQAEVMAAVGLLSESSRMLDEAVPILDQHKLSQESARASAAQGRVLLKLGRTTDALASLDLAQKGFEALSNSTGKARIRLARAELAASTGNRQLATDLLRESIATTADRPVDNALAHLQLGALFCEAGDPSLALPEIDAALEVATRLDLAPLLADALHARARVRWALSQTEGAMQDLRGAVAQLERLRGTLRHDFYRAAFLGDRLAPYNELSVGALNTGHQDEAFETIERAKSRTLLDLLQGGLGAASTGGDEELRALVDLDQERGILNALYAGVTSAGSRAQTPDLTNLASRISSHEQRITALEGKIASTSRYAGVFSQPVHLGQVQASLAPTEALVEFFVENGAFSAFVVRPGAVTVHRNLCPVASVTENVAALYFQMMRAVPHVSPPGPRAARMRQDADRELATLYDALIKPIERDIDGALQLLVIPHGPLHAIPFHALRRNDRYLVQDLDVAIAPSSSLMHHLRHKATPGPQNHLPLVVGVADELAPNAEAEAQHVAGCLEGSRLLLGSGATHCEVTRQLADASVVHVASHARFVRNDPLASGVKVHAGWLTARDILQVRLHNATVVLSGCDTGRSVIASADELLGLVRSFLAAGASSIVMSLWPLHDQTASELMADFYTRVYSGQRALRLGPCAALAACQRALLIEAVHPVTWAPLVFLGSP